ncbi:zf-HC2 domain-containing protein [Actinoplanes sp. LDG1-06]|uniref:Zf-HC2 domain-containing protein n=1 Tax=Paractinoplanes ovalisporus TaxID=2810368 RepID=A0ABS2AE48_9ACTN|nr:zf-HC2 domain-containing protein [Actinoplanes ovalisporus]MBM2618105.1 zf-HC2 domain-containing protein [Actinoplanes ovalisporus]
MSTDHDELHRLLGGYLLGGLDEADTDRLDAHLRDCDRCRDELDRLAAVPELLRRLPEAHREEPGVAFSPVSMSAKPSQENIDGLLRRMRAEQSRQSRVAGVRWLAAAAVVLVAVAIGFGVLRGNRENRPPQVLPSPELVTAQFQPAEGSGMAGQAVLTPKTWGVSVALDVSRLKGQGPFHCEVRGLSGQVEQAMVWGPTPSGNAKVIGASSIQLTNVSRIEVLDHDRHVLGTADLE